MISPRTRKASLLICLVIAVAYTIAAFCTAFPQFGREFWCGYGFTLLCFLVETPLFLWCLDGERGFRDLLLRSPVMLTGLIYALFQMIFGFKVLTMQVSYTAGLYISLVAFLIFAVTESMLFAKRKINEMSTNGLRKYSEKIEPLIAQTDSLALKAKLSLLLELIHCGNPVQKPELQRHDIEIDEKVRLLGAAVLGGEEARAISLCDQLTELVSDRNAKSIF